MAAAGLLARTSQRSIYTILLVFIFSSCLSVSASQIPKEACFASRTSSPHSMQNSVKRSWGVLEKLSTPHSFDTFRLFMKEDGTFVNNRDHPLLLFQSAFTKSRAYAERSIVEAGWTSPWAWGIFPYHHYHSTAWELLVCVRGQGLIKLGGETGPEVKVHKGDVMLVPPGFVHKQLDETGGFTLLGSYPPNSGHIDILTGPPTDIEKENIKKCIAPIHEPVLGIDISGLYE